MSNDTKDRIPEAAPESFCSTAMQAPIGRTSPERQTEVMERIKAFVGRFIGTCGEQA